MAKIVPVGVLMINAFIWGVSWWPLRELQTAGLHPLWSTVIMYCFAMAIVLIYKPRVWRALINHPQLWLLLLASGFTNVSFNWAVSISDVVRVLILFYLMPAWVVLLAWLILKERPNRFSYFRLVLAMTGVFIVLLPSTSLKSSTLFAQSLSFADVLAILGGFTFALTQVLVKRLGETPQEERLFAMFAGGAVLAALAAVLGIAQGWVSALPDANAYWLTVAALLAVAFLIGNSALQYAATRLPANTTALVMLTEIIFGSLSAVWLGAATLDAKTLLGGSLIFIAAALAAGEN